MKTEHRPTEDGEFDELVCKDVSTVHIEMLDHDLMDISLYGGYDGEHHVQVRVCVEDGRLCVVSEENP